MPFMLLLFFYFTQNIKYADETMYIVYGNKQIYKRKDRHSTQY
jgi:hypothetical protein